MAHAPFDTTYRIDTTADGTRRLVETRSFWNANKTGALSLERVVATSATEAGREAIAAHHGRG